MIPSGLMLSIMLAGCAHDSAEPPRTVAIAVRDVPPAELTTCPVPPEGFPVDQAATMPPAVRAAAIRDRKSVV